MDLEQSKAEAERLFTEAGWAPIVSTTMAGRFVALELGLVGGRPPRGAEAAVKSWTAIPPGHPQYGPDTPDEPHEAAAWLIARYADNPLASAATLAAPVAEIVEASDVRHPESEEAAPEAAADESVISGGAGAAAEGHDGSAADGGDGGGGALVPAHGSDGEGDSYEDEDGPAVWDADFAEPELTQHPDDEFGGELDDPEGRLGLEGPDLGAEIADAEDEAFVPSEPSRFYGLDDLDRRRSLRIGDVIRHAKTLMPFWTTAGLHATHAYSRGYLMTEHEQVAEIFRAAGWTAGTRDGWNGSFVWAGTSVVGGIDPWGTARTTGIVHNPLEGPTNIVDAAHWLVEHARSLRLAPVTEPAQVFFYEAHSETGAEADAPDDLGLGLFEQAGSDGAGGVDETVLRAGTEGEEFSADFEEGGGEDLGSATEPAEPHTELAEALSLGAEILDADFTDPTDPPPEDHPSGAFIFGDNLHQMRTAAIGLVVQAALERLPAAIDYPRMSELRNFTMGVSEGRWPDDPAKREELDLLEATERLRRAIEAIRDAKIETLLTATREEIEAFDTQAGWP